MRPPRLMSVLLGSVGRARGGVRAAIIATVAMAGAGTVGVAVAAFTANGSAITTAGAGTLSAPLLGSATAGAGTVALSWPAVTPPSGTGGVSYYVSREGGIGGDCPSSAAPTSVTSCTDAGLTAGTYHYTVTAVWRSWTAHSTGTAVTVASGALDHFVLGAASTTPMAGAADNLTITAKDAAGNTVTTYTGDKSLTFSGASNAPNGAAPTVSDKSGSAVAFGTAETITFTNGIASASGSSNGVMKLYKTQTASIVVTQGAVTSAGLPVTVGDAGASSLAVTPGTSSPTAGSQFNVTVTAKDAYLNTATSYSGTEHLDLSGPHAAPDGTDNPTWTGTNVAETFTSGTVTIPTTLYDAETTTLIAKDHTITSITGTSSSVTVGDAGAHSFALTNTSGGTLGTQTAGTAFSVKLTAKDLYLNTAASYTGTKTIDWSGPGTAPGGNAPAYPTSATSVSFTGGAGTASAITLYKAETPTLTAKDHSATSITGSASFTVNDAGASSLVVTPASFSPTAGTPFNVTVTAKDAYLNTATSYTGSEHLNLTGPHTAPDGTHTPTWTGTGVPETFAAGAVTIPTTLYDAETTALTATDSTTTSITGTSSTVTVGSAGASSFALTNTSGGTLGTQTAGTAFSVKLTAKDAYLNTATGYNGNKTIDWSGPGNAPNGNAPSYPSSATSLNFTGNTGTATASGITLYKAQNATLTATDHNTPSINGSASITVGDAGAHTLVVTPATFSPTAGTQFNVTVTAKDTYLNTATSYSGSEHLDLSGPHPAPDGTHTPTWTGTNVAETFTSGTVTIPTTLYDAETVTLTAKDHTTTSITGTSSSVAISDAGASSFALTNTSGGTLGAQTAGTAFSVKLTAKDTYLNTAASYSGAKTIDWSGPVAAPDGTAPSYPASATAVTFSAGAGTATAITLYKAETATLTATDHTASSINGSATFTVNDAGASRLWWEGVSISKGSVACAPFSCSWTSATNGTFTASIGVTDGHGNVVTNLGSGHTVSISATTGVTSLTPTSLTIASTGAAISTATFTLTTTTGNWSPGTLTAATTGGTSYTSATAAYSR